MRSRYAAGLVLAILVAACGSGDAADSTTSAPTPTTTAPPATTTSEQATTTVAPTTTAPLPEFPPARVDLEQGGSTWAVVLAGAPDSDDPAITDAVAAAEDAGYTTGPTDCDEGAAEALGQDGYALTISVYFDTEADAQAAAAAFEARGVTGVVAEIQTFCLD
jgi:hypothetical protein